MASAGSYNQDGGRGELDFDRLVELHYASLYRFAMSLTRHESDAADLVQDTFSIWAAKGHQLREPAKVRSWLFTTLHRQYLETQRRSTRFPQLEWAEETPELPHLEPDVVNHLDSRLILELLAQVDAQFHAAVALFYLEDCSYNEIALILEVPLGTVKSRIARGLTQLKALVAGRTSPATTRKASA